MKLLYVTATLPYGAGEAFLAPEVDELIRLGCDVRLIPRNPRGDFIHNDVRHLQARTMAAPLLSPGIIMAACREALRRPLVVARTLAMILAGGNITTIAKNLAVFPKGLWLAGIARRWGADHIHAHWLSTPATMAMIAGKLSGIPWSCTSHRVDIVHRNLLPQKLREARFVRFISESGRAMVREYGMFDADGKTVVLHVGVTLPEDVKPDVGWTSSPSASEMDGLEVHPTPTAPLTVLCAANLYPVKGHQYLLRAAALLRDRRVPCTFRIVGRGACQRDLEALSAELDLNDRVQFVGQVSHEELLGMYRRREVGIAVLPSVDLGNHLHEGIPVTLMEAMAYGIPVVATDTGGIPELIYDGAGMLVEEKNPEALAAAIEKLVGDPGLRCTLAAAGRQRIAQEFEVRSITAELLRRIQGVPSRETGTTKVEVTHF